MRTPLRSGELPGIAPLVRAPGHFEQAHSAEDTLDQVSPADLGQAVTVLAMASFFLADAHDIALGDFTQPKRRPR